VTPVAPAAQVIAAATPARIVGRPIVIGVFGDSFAQGIWYALDHGLPPARYKVIDFSRAATGFTRPDVEDVTLDAQKALGGRSIDIAVADFGANDTQGIRDQGKVYPLLTPGWRTVYAGRIGRFVALLRSRGARVYWVGLPKMRSAAYDEHVADLMSFYAQTLGQLGVPLVSVRQLTVDRTGAFSPYLQDAANRRVLMRTNDGIHMSMAGYGHIAQPLIDRLNADYPAALLH